MAEPTAKRTRGPLEGIRVLELSQFIAGPVCGRLLADQGAEVIKVERPEGEDGRRIGPFAGDLSLYYAALNRNKRGVTANLKSAEGVDLLLALAEHSDIIIENFRPGALARYGFGYDRLAARDARIIQVSISGFGQAGPYRNLPAFDQIVQALSGAMLVTGSEEDGPIKSGISIADYSAGTHAALGASLALLERERSGKGSFVDISLFDTMSVMLEEAIVSEAAGIPMLRVKNGRPGAVPGDAYRCADGWVYIAATSQSLWERLTHAIGRDDLLQDERFRTNPQRVQARSEIDQLVSGWTTQRSVDQVVQIMREADVPCSPVRGVESLLSDEQLASRGMLLDLDAPGSENLVTLGNPVKANWPDESRSLPAPGLGEHNADVYGGLLGLSADELDGLRERGAI